MEGKWILEDGDLDAIYCNQCGYPTREFSFKYSKDKNIVVECFNECPNCKAKMNDFTIKGNHIENIIRDNLDKNNGEYYPH